MIYEREQKIKKWIDLYGIVCGPVLYCVLPYVSEREISGLDLYGGRRTKSAFKFSGLLGRVFAELFFESFRRTSLAPYVGYESWIRRRYIIYIKLLCYRGPAESCICTCF